MPDRTHLRWPHGRPGRDWVIGDPRTDPFLAQRLKADRWVLRRARAFARDLRRLFGEMERVTLAKLTGPKVLRGTVWDRKTPGTKDIDPADLFDVDQWADRLDELGRAWVLDVITEAGFDAAAQLGAPFTAADPRVAEAVTLRANKIKGAAQTTFDAIAAQLARGYEDGDTLQQLAARVRTVFDVATRYRSEMIARTEVMGAMNTGHLIAARQSGVVETKTWVATLDDRTREAHADADGQTVRLDERFVVGDEEMDGPGDQDADAGNVINCRCSIVFGLTVRHGEEEEV